MITRHTLYCTPVLGTLGGPVGPGLVVVALAVDVGDLLARADGAARHQHHSPALSSGRVTIRAGNDPLRSLNKKQSLRKPLLGPSLG